MSQATGAERDAGTKLTRRLGGADAALFNIRGSGAVTFKTAPNFEAPADAGGNNVYDITVTASDGTLSSTARPVAITVTNMNEAPSVTSGTTVSFAENGTWSLYTRYDAVAPTRIYISCVCTVLLPDSKTQVC